MDKTLDKRSRVWLAVSVMATLVPAIGSQIVEYDSSIEDVSMHSVSQSFGVLAIVSGISALILLIACFTVKGRYKLVPIAGVIIALLVTAVSGFNYKFLDGSMVF